MPKIPDRWLQYKPIGEKIEGTRFICFKVPLEEEVNKAVPPEKRLDSTKLIENIPNLGLIIDLTFTDKYYNPKINFINKGINYTKLFIPGHDVPKEPLRLKFHEIVANFLKSNHDNDKLIGVHCTHGVNRTGFLICHHMVTVMNIPPETALKRFEIARGHQIERMPYIDCIKSSIYKGKNISHPNTYPAPGPYRLRKRSLSTDNSLKYNPYKKPVNIEANIHEPRRRISRVNLPRNSNIVENSHSNISSYNSNYNTINHSFNTRNIRDHSNYNARNGSNPIYNIRDHSNYNARNDSNSNYNTGFQSNNNVRNDSNSNNNSGYQSNNNIRIDTNSHYSTGYQSINNGRNESNPIYNIRDHSNYNARNDSNSNYNIRDQSNYTVRNDSNSNNNSGYQSNYTVRNDSNYTTRSYPYIRDPKYSYNRSMQTDRRV